jgi:hypothetical protein
MGPPTCSQGRAILQGHVGFLEVGFADARADRLKIIVTGT